MRRLSLAGYLFVFLWSVWFFAIQGFLVNGGLGLWVPDLGLVLLLGLDARLRSDEMRRVALLVALARATFSADSAAAILTGYLGVVGVTSALRKGLEIDGFLLRSLVAAFFSATLSAWWMVCHQLGLETPLTIAPELLGPAALSTAACALIVGPALVRLPGFSSIRGRRR
jgi:hypothetical protein